MGMTKKSMTLDEIDLYEKRSAAIHEAGHVTVAASFFRYCGAFIRREGNGGDETLHKWIGQAVTGRECHGLEPMKKAAVGIAGITAECLMEDEELDGFTLVDYIDSDAIAPSPTDWVAMKYIGTPDEYDCGKMESAADTAIAAIKAHRALFDWVRAQLLDEGTVSDGMVEDFVRSITTSEN